MPQEDRLLLRPDGLRLRGEVPHHRLVGHLLRLRTAGMHGRIVFVRRRRSRRKNHSPTFTWGKKERRNLGARFSARQLYSSASPPTRFTVITGSGETRAYLENFAGNCAMMPLLNTSAMPRMCWTTWS